MEGVLPDKYTAVKVVRQDGTELKVTGVQCGSEAEGEIVVRAEQRVEGCVVRVE